MSLTGILLQITGVIHCAVGIAIPELRGPFLRTLTERKVEFPGIDWQERHARECAVWFHFGGIMMLLQGHYISSKKEEAPAWFGWSLVGIGCAGILVMPVSMGFG